MWFFPLPPSKSDLGAELGDNTYTIVINLTFDMCNHSLYLSILLFFCKFCFSFHHAYILFSISFFLTISIFLTLSNIIKLQLSHVPFLSNHPHFPCIIVLQFDPYSFYLYANPMHFFHANLSLFYSIHIQCSPTNSWLCIFLF